MDTVHFILQRFEIRNMKRCCNFRGCRKTPTKELLLLEFDRRRPARRVASLYLCEKHCTREAKSISNELKTEAGKYIGGRIFDINYITH